MSQAVRYSPFQTTAFSTNLDEVVVLIAQYGKCENCAEIHSHFNIYNGRIDLSSWRWHCRIFDPIDPEKIIDRNATSQRVA